MAKQDTQLNIIVDAQNRTQGTFNTLRGNLDAVRQSHERLIDGMKTAGKVGAVAFAGITFGVGKAVSEASRIQEIDRLFDATFDTTEDRMAKWSEEVADRFGRAEQDIRQMAATAGSVLGPAFDIAESEIADMTIGMGEAAIALAATDVRIENAQQAMEGFTQALTGNRQRVIDWGFQVRDAQLEARALKDGIIGANESLTEQQKAMLTAKMITEQVSVSTQVLADSQEDWSQISKRLAGQMKELMGVLGEQFLPIVEDVASVMVPVISAMGDWAEEHPILTRNIIIAAAAIAGLLALLFPLAIMLPGLVLMWGGLATAFAFIVAGPGAAIIAIVAGIGFAVMQLTRIVLLLKNDWDKVWLGMKLMAAEAANGVIGAMESMINFVIDGVNIMIRGVNRVLSMLSRIPKIGSKFSGFKIGELEKTNLGRIDTETIAASSLNRNRPSDTTVVNISGNTFLDQDTAEHIGDMMLGRLKLSNPL